MIQKLVNEIKKKNAPIVVGLDPQMSFIPEELLNKYYAEKGNTLEAVADMILFLL